MFLWLTFGDLLGRVPEGSEFGRQGLHRRERDISVTVLGDALASDFCGTQTSIEPGRAKLRISLTLASDDGFGVHGDPQDVVGLISAVIHMGDLREDRVGFGDFFVADFWRPSWDSTQGH